MLTATIMQPTYLSWIGYFDLIDQSDTFVFLDSVQFDRRSWQQRNRVKSRDRVLWLTVPVHSKGRRDQRICDVEIDRSAKFEQKQLSTIRQCYAQAEYFDTYFNDLSTILEGGHEKLVDLNVNLIEWFCQKLGLDATFVRSSNLEAGGDKADLLVNICQEVGADRYLSPPGSQAYLDAQNPFPAKGIDLVYQDYPHPVYRQLFGEFVPYLSVLDLLMNEGSGSLNLLRQKATL
jgi:hypothetical protein